MPASWSSKGMPPDWDERHKRAWSRGLQALGSCCSRLSSVSPIAPLPFGLGLPHDRTFGSAFPFLSPKYLANRQERCFSANVVLVK
jgi:hypothetical protein